MRLSEYIKNLQELESQVGDVRVTTYSLGSVDVVDALPPVLKEIREKRPRERCSYYRNFPEEIKKETVVHVN